MRFSLAIDLSILFILYLTHLLSHSFLFSHLKFVDNLRIPPKESMASIDETYSHTGFNVRLATFTSACMLMICCAEVYATI